MGISAVHDNGNLYIVTFTNGTVTYVPKVPLNADYERVQAWAAAGGVIQS